MFLQKFALATIHHGVDLNKIDQEHDIELRQFLETFLRFQQHNEEAAEVPLYFKFKAYEPYSFTLRISQEGEVSDPFVFLRFRSEALLGKDMETYINACYQRDRVGYPSSGQRRLEDQRRRETHIRLAEKIIDVFKAHKLVFDGVENSEIIPKMRILIARMAQFHPKLEMREASNSASDHIRSHLQNGPIGP